MAASPSTPPPTSATFTSSTANLSDPELASFPTSWVTAENMLNRAGVGPRDWVLVTGASGGVGSALIQLAGRRGARTIALCAEEKADGIRTAGAEHVLPRTPPDLRAALRHSTGRGEVTVVADVVGGPLWPQLVSVLARGGRYVCAGAIAGPLVRFDLRTFYLRDLTLVGATVAHPASLRRSRGLHRTGRGSVDARRGLSSA